MEETFALAFQNHKKNNLQTAEKLYKEVLKRKPNHFETIYYLSKLFAETKRFNLAKSMLEKAIQLKPNYAKAHNNLGIILTKLKENQKAINSFKNAIQIQSNYSNAHYNLGIVMQEIGENKEAIIYYEKAIKLKPDYARAYNNLGIALQELGEHRKAIIYYKKAIQQKPDYSDAHYNLGRVMQELGENKEAIIYYEKAIQLKPDYAKAYNNLGIALQELGQHRKAINVYKKAILIVPNSIIINGLSDLFKSIKLGNITKDNSDDLKELFLFLYKKNNINHDNIFHNSKLLLFLDENENKFKKIIYSNSALLKNKIIQNLLNDELFLLMLQKSLIADKFLEKILTKLRNEILLSLIDSNENILKKYFDFIISLAEQCFLNEFVYNQCRKEISFINKLKDKINNNNEVNELEVAILGCYIPLYTSKKIVNKLTNYKSKNILFNNLISINIREPLEEIKLTSSIKSFKKIVDTVSKKVREQYEEHPYPRWKYVNKYSHANFLLQLNEEIKPNKIKYNNKFLNPNVLIAGCGTGQHIASAERYLNSKILGVDISLKSLAYAKRKTLELNLKNIEFLHADILQLKNLNKKFDVIECVGTLHHMKDPLSGLKILLNLLEPHGFLKLGLYSQIARQNIIKARELIKRKKIKNTTEDIRAFRESIINENDDHPLQKIFNIKDFYSTSMARDLIFHVQEHRFTLTGISKILKDFNLEFLGFINSSIKIEYSKSFYNDTKNTSLDNWNKFEMANQETFSNMYQFWIRKL